VVFHPLLEEKECWAMTDNSERTRKVRNKINQEAGPQIVDWLLAIDFDTGHAGRGLRQ